MASNQKRPASSNYRKPPVAHQFKKGLSGNPNGRPKKQLDPGTSGFGGGIHDMLQTVVLSEASRSIKVREGDKIQELTALQALIRSNFRLAAQGDPKTARQLLEMVSRAEASRTAFAKELLESVAQYKSEYGPIFQQHERDGLEPPDIYPHPDDIIIDVETGEITIDGPIDREQAGAQKAVLSYAAERFGRFLEIEATLKNDPKNRAVRKEYNDLKAYDDYFRRMGARSIRRVALKKGREALNSNHSNPTAKKSKPRSGT